MWILVLVGIAALTAAAAASAQRAKCPVTGAVLTDAQLSDPSLKVGDKTFCCPGCVREYAANPGGYAA